VGVVKGTHTTDIIANVATLSDSFIEIALTQYIDAIPGADVFRSTELDAYADYCIYMWGVFADLISQKYQIDALPGISRNDGAAGSPFTRASWNGLVGSLLGMHMPYVVRNLLKITCTPVVVDPGNPVYGYPERIWYGLSPQYTLANIEAHLGTAAGFFHGLGGSNQLGRLGSPVTLQDFQYFAPVPRFTPLGDFLTMYWPAADDGAGVSEDVRDNTFDLRFNRWVHQEGKLPWYYDLVGMLCVGATAGWDVLVNTAGAAGKTNFEYADIGDTSWTAVPDYAADAATNLTYVGDFRHQLYAGLGYTNKYQHGIVVKDNMFSGEDAFTRRQINQLTSNLVARDISGARGMINRTSRPNAQTIVVGGSQGSSPSQYDRTAARNATSEDLSRTGVGSELGGRGKGGPL
jgi:hypothetical protein